MGVLCGVGCSATKLERQKNTDLVELVRKQTLYRFLFCQHARDMAQPVANSGSMLVGHQWECKCTHSD